MRFELGGDGVGVTRLSTGTIAVSGQQRVWVRVVADASDGTRNRHDDGIYSWMLQYPVDRRPRVLRVPLNRMQVLTESSPTTTRVWQVLITRKQTEYLILMFSN